VSISLPKNYACFTLPIIDVGQSSEVSLQVNSDRLAIQHYVCSCFTAELPEFTSNHLYSLVVAIILMTRLSRFFLSWRVLRLPISHVGKTLSVKLKTGLYRRLCGQTPITGIGALSSFGSHLLQPIPAFPSELGPLGTHWCHWRGCLWTHAWKLSREPTFKHATRRSAWCIATWRRTALSYGKSFGSILVCLLSCSCRVLVPLFECDCLGHVIMIALTFICHYSIRL